MKPNHHFATHTAPQIRDYGPVYNFWAFLTERLNGLLKTFKLNNWNRGRLEVSMMRAFMRSVFVKTMVRRYIHGTHLELMNIIRYETSRPLVLMDLNLRVTIQAS